MLVNGKHLNTVEVSDRGLAYGDGLFESILLHHGSPVLLQTHLQRLQRGCHRLAIPDCGAELEQDIAVLQARFPDSGVLKIIITRGVGGRGYMPARDMSPTRILTLHSLPDFSPRQPQHGIDAFVCSQRLARQPSLAGIKHLNRLEQVMAGLEWPGDNILEGIMLDTEDLVIEGTRSNIFLAEAGRLITPDLHNCGIEGVMRNILLESFDTESIAMEACSLQRLLEAEEVFVCNSVWGIWPVKNLHLQDQVRRYNPGRFSDRARQIFEEILTANAP